MKENLPVEEEPTTKRRKELKTVSSVLVAWPIAGPSPLTDERDVTTSG